MRGRLSNTALVILSLDELATILHPRRRESAVHDKPAGAEVPVVMLWKVKLESSRIRKNSDAFEVGAPNSHESGYRETTRSNPREVSLNDRFLRYDPYPTLYSGFRSGGRLVITWLLVCDLRHGPCPSGVVCES